MIAITGLGAITALGGTALETWERAVRGERAFGDVSLFAADGYRVRTVAEVTSVPPLVMASAYPVSADAPDLSRTSELALIAAREALASASLAPGVRIGLVVGGSTSGLFETESALSVLRLPGGALDPKARDDARAMMNRHPMSGPTDRLARKLGPFARVRTLSSACSSGANAIVVGATWLELGLVDAVLCGAADGLCRLTLSGFNALGALDPEGARPFDRRRKGLTLGEGAGFVVLERAPEAAARGKAAVCMLLGWAARAEAHHITNPEPTGEAPARAMAAALRMARLEAADIDYVNAHGTGTPLNDPMESKALARVLGSELARIPVSTQKGQFGHTLASAGAIEATVTALAIARGIVPPTGGLEEPDPACALRHVLTAEERPIRAAISSSFAFGGMDTVLVLGAPSHASRSTASARAAAPDVRARSVVITGAAALTPAGLFTGAAIADIPKRLSAEGELAAALDADVSDALTFDVNAALDADRSRRLDRQSRIAAVVCGKALGDDARDPGVIFANAFGAVDGTTTYMQRLREKGARLASPADFPNLVPSSPAGHVSIYSRLEGPTFSVADLATSGECAFTQGFEMIAAGETDRMVVVAVEEKSVIVDEIFRAIFGPHEDHPLRREGAGAVALAAEDAARARGLPVLARVTSVLSWWHDEHASARITPPRDVARACVVLGAARAETLTALESSPWARCRRVICEERAGSHEAVGAIAIAVAATSCSSDPSLDEVLCIGVARGSGYAITLMRGSPHA